MAAYPYSAQTADLTVEQVEGEACVKCGRTFQPGEASRPTGETFGGSQLFAHVTCPKGGATR